MSKPKFINNLERARRNRDLSRTEASKVLSAFGYKGDSALEHYEAGHSLPPLRTALALAHLYRTSIIALWSELQAEVAEVVNKAEEALRGPALAAEEVADD